VHPGTSVKKRTIFKILIDSAFLNKNVDMVKDWDFQSLSPLLYTTTPDATGVIDSAPQRTLRTEPVRVPSTAIIPGSAANSATGILSAPSIG
jgi:hypothetical protein